MITLLMPVPPQVVVWAGQQVVSKTGASSLGRTDNELLVEEIWRG